MSSSTIYNQSRPRGARQNRNGFTLTELLIAITIIGLLVGLLATAGAGVIRRSQEFAVSTEVIQMSQSIENFKTKFGFFPPSFEQFKRQSNNSALALVPAEANQLLPFLNKIAPNHRERELSPSGSGLRRIDEWWLGVGVNLNQQTSLQFWLSGLCQNKQYPLTGGLAGGIPKGFNINEFIDGSEIVGGLERDVLYDFDEDRLIPVADLAGTTNSPIAQYNMNHGKTNGDLFYLYRDSASYLPYVQPAPVASGNPGTGGPGLAPDFTYSGSSTPSLSALETYLALDFSTNLGHSGAAYYAKQFSPDGSELRLRFGNPNSFQLISAGVDGEAGVSAASVDRGDVELQLPSSADNLCNFADGRLDKFVNEIEGVF